jgi:hypothetical protein
VAKDSDQWWTPLNTVMKLRALLDRELVEYLSQH